MSFFFLGMNVLLYVSILNQNGEMGMSVNENLTLNSWFLA